MDNDRFQLLVDILKILEKRGPSDPDAMESIIDVIDNFDNDLDAEQRSLILKEFLQFKSKKEESDRKFEDERHREYLEQSLKRDFF